MRITYVGHSTVLLELDGLRLLTDPILRRRVLHLVRAPGGVDTGGLGAVDAVLISHMHHDHFDPASLRAIEGRFALVMPRNAAKAAAKHGFDRVAELGVGESTRVGGLAVAATPAVHRKGRFIDRRSEAIGYLVAGTQRVYFAGDTDVYPAMSELQGQVDVALVPIGGWGPKLGPGHMDARRAAEALGLIRPRIAIPIHWGTLYRVGLSRSHHLEIDAAPEVFASAAAEVAPSVDVRVLQPGQATVVDPSAA